MPNLSELPKEPLSTFKGIVFNLGSLTDPIHGTTTTFQGEIPFLVPAEKRRLPKLLYEPERLHQYALELLPHVRNVFSDLLDEEILEVVKDNLMFPDVISATDWEPRMLKFLAISSIQAFLFDDFMDDGADSEPSEPFMSYTSFKQIFKDAMEKLKEQNNFEHFSLTDIFDTFPTVHPKLQTLKDLANYADELFDKKFFEGRELNFELKVIQKEVSNFILANLAMKEVQRDGKRYSLSTLMEMLRVGAGNRLNVFLEMHYRNAYPGEEVVEDIVFQTLFKNYLDVTLYYNAIVGLPRDLKKNQVDGAIMYLLIIKGRPLKQAYNEVYEKMHDAISDFKLNSAKIIEFYPENENLKIVVEVMQRYIDGLAILHKFVRRYGVHDNLKFAKELGKTYE